MTARKYPIATIQQMAEIPADAIPRFLAEMPDILAQMRRVKESAPFLEALGLSFEMGVPEWVDDDLSTATITVELPDGEKVSASRKIEKDAQ